MRVSPIITWWIIPVCATALLATSCSTGKPDISIADAREAFYTQHVTWEPCAAEAEPWFPDITDDRTCARVLAPLDYRAPGRLTPDTVETVSLAVARLPATEHKRGTLVLISGGPGEPGLDMLNMPFPEQIRRNFDIVSYDPRGVGRTRPAIVCNSQDEEQLDEQQDPVTAAEQSRRLFVNSCIAGTGKEVLRHIGSDEATDDLDILRGVLGKQQLNILAASYGTQVAAMYIDRYPRGYRAAALDGVVDVTETHTQMRIGQGRGYQDTFNRVARFCAGRADCPLGPDPDQAENVFRAILRSVKDHPVPAGAAAIGPDDILQALSKSYLWPTGWVPFLDALTAIRNGDGTPMHNLTAEETSEPPRQTSSAAQTASDALEVITCADFAQPTDDRRSRQADEQALYDATTYDHYEPRPTEFPLDTCAFWPNRGSAKVFHPARAQNSPPVLFIGTRHDPTTPLSNAERMARYLASPLLIREGDGHTFVFGEVNTCIDDRVVGYFENPDTAQAIVCAEEPE
ncbi:alpha/beta hydrolase [Nocardia yamanashiensis]|uniref:alpha/beta hydrolase n=1 Tax=Nocardia yamanashiensis TaxID=209247 RepID=UPI001E36EE5A|nr:alpha/beta hydrolase [Nocardia yamanashiensis]UGT43183.1 alpha/beta hydrolase [Nocardia yamanashiensis]